jgi:starch synthase
MTDELAHLIAGASDIVLVPAGYEARGLTQLCALRYGAPPPVSRGGGLADTVVDATAVSLADGTAAGFAFDTANPQAMRAAIERSRNLFAERRSGGGWCGRQ